MTHPTPRPPLPLRTVVIYSAGALVALALGAFMLLASRGGAAATPAPSPEAVERNLRANEREVREKIRTVWAAYDKAPRDDASKLRLVTATASARTLAEGAPARARQDILGEIGAASRARVAPLIRPESWTTDNGSRTLVPANDAPRCRLWASMWRNESADDLKQLGFTHIACPALGESWTL